MNKLTAIFVVLFIVGAGCTEKTVDRNMPAEYATTGPTMTQETALEKTAPSKSEDWKKGYHFEGDYLLHDDKKLFDEPLSTVLDENDGPETEYGIAYTLDEADETRLILFKGGGCEGCSRLVKKFIEVDKKTGAASLGEYQGSELSALFVRGGGDLAATSPDGAEIAFLTGWMDNGTDTDEPEMIWTFDLKTGREEKIATVKKGYSVMTDSNSIPAMDEKLLYWNPAPQELIVKVPTMPKTVSGNKEISIGNGPDVHAFDFDGDGIDEYVVYQEKGLPQPAMFNFSETGVNGAYEIFRWGKDGWKMIFEDEDTVGKKGYAVFSRLNRERFFKIADTDNDGAPEARISFDLEGSGGYSKSYTLEWDGTKLIKKDITTE